jgi:DNA-binding transcriptional LysR family regulator
LLRGGFVGGRAGKCDFHMEHPFASGPPALGRLAIDEPTVLSGRFWAELRTFLAVAKAKSLSRAADEVGLSRMTAAREIRRLQDAIGAQLVVFSKTGAALTPRGEKLALALQKLDHDIFSLTSDLRAEGGQAEGLVRLSVTDGLGIFYVLPVVSELTVRHPRIRLQFLAPNNLLSLGENRTDLMIGFSGESSRQLTSRHAGTMHLVPFASRDYIAKNGLPDKHNLSDHYILHSSMYTGKSDIWRPWRSILEAGRQGHGSDSSLTYGFMVKAGLGVGLMSSVHAVNAFLVPLDLDCHIQLPLHVVALTERLQSRPVRIVYECLVAALSDARPWLGPDVALERRDSELERAYHTLLSS